MILGGGAGAETQTSKKYCSQDKATDIEARGNFHDDPLYLFPVKDRTARLLKRSTAALKIDKGLELTRLAKCRCHWNAAAKALWEVSERKGDLPRLKLWRSNFPAYLY
jgi:hypothetical protein